MMRRAAAPEDEGDEEDEDEEGEEIGGETSGSGTGSDSDLPPASRSDESDASAGGRGGAGWPRPAGSGRTGEFLSESDEDGAPRPPARPSSSFPPAFPCPMRHVRIGALLLRSVPGARPKASFHMSSGYTRGT